MEINQADSDAFRKAWDRYQWCRAQSARITKVVQLQSAAAAAIVAERTAEIEASADVILGWNPERQEKIAHAIADLAHGHRELADAFGSEAQALLDVNAAANTIIQQLRQSVG